MRRVGRGESQDVRRPRGQEGERLKKNVKRLAYPTWLGYVGKAPGERQPSPWIGVFRVGCGVCQPHSVTVTGMYLVKSVTGKD